MKWWTWGLLALPIISLALVFGVLQPWASGNSSAALGAPVSHWAIDVVQDAGAGTPGDLTDDVWCNPVNDTTNVALSSVHKAAICLVDLDGVVAANFNVQVFYSNSLNSCVNGVQTYPATNANPDFIGDVSNPDGWDCTGGGQNPPTCGSGTAFITCHATGDPGPLVGTAWAVAVITWTAGATPGTDTLTFGTTAGYDIDNAYELPFCPPAGDMCVGATVTKGEVPPATPTITNTPLPTATPTITNTPTMTPTPTATATATATATFTPLPTPYADIDKIEDTGWCDTVDNQSTEVVGASHSLAVCAHNMPDNIAGFDLTISYDDELDACTDTEIDCTEGPCLNDNPDLAEVLGESWNCMGNGQPVCDQAQAGALTSTGSGHAVISCEGTSSVQSGPLAILNLDVLAAGEDTVTIDSLVVYDDTGEPMAECGAVVDGDGAFLMDCLPATDTKVEASPTPTATFTPTPTATPTSTITPTPCPTTGCPTPTATAEQRVRRRTDTPEPSATAEPATPVVAPTVPVISVIPTATPSGGAGPNIVAPPTGSGGSSSPTVWTYWLAATAAVAASATGFAIVIRRRRRSQ